MKLHFYPELTTVCETTFNGKRDKPTKRYKFLVIEHDNPDDIPLEYQNPKEWDTGSEVAKELNDYFKEGKVDQITRKGLEMGTKYRIQFSKRSSYNQPTSPSFLAFCMKHFRLVYQ
jgi:hypothetical protein